MSDLEELEDYVDERISFHWDNIHAADTRGDDSSRYQNKLDEVKEVKEKIQEVKQNK